MPKTSPPIRGSISASSTTSTQRAPKPCRRARCRAALVIGRRLRSRAVDAVLIASSTDTHAEHLCAAAAVGIPGCARSPRPGPRAGPSGRVFVAGQRHCRDGRLQSSLRPRLRRTPARRQLRGDGRRASHPDDLPRSVLPPLSYVAVSGGQMRDQTVHFFDLVRWISGLIPWRFSLPVRRWPNQGLWSTTTSTPPRSRCGSPEGRWSRSIRAPNRIRVRRTHRDYGIQAWWKPGGTGTGRSRGTPALRWWTTACIPAGSNGFNRLRAALAAFVSALEGGTAPSPSLEDGLKAQAIAEAATRSLTTARMEPIAYA